MKHTFFANTYDKYHQSTTHSIVGFSMTNFNGFFVARFLIGRKILFNKTPGWVANVFTPNSEGKFSKIAMGAFGFPSEMTPMDYEAFLGEHEEGNKDIKLPCPTLEKVINKLSSLRCRINKPFNVF